jgi:hypothetical protein
VATLQIQLLNLNTTISCRFYTNIHHDIAFGADNALLCLAFALPTAGGTAHGNNIMAPQERLPSYQRHT